MSYSSISRQSASVEEPMVFTAKTKRFLPLCLLLVHGWGKSCCVISIRMLQRQCLSETFDDC